VASRSRGALEREVIACLAAAGRPYAYSLTGGPATARVNVVAHRMLRLLDDETDRAAVLTRFVGELQPGDEQLLTELLRGRE